MQKFNFKLIYSLIAIFAAIIVSIACGGYDYGYQESEESSFASEYFLQQSLAPFFKSDDSYLEGSQTHNERFDSIMLSEWSTYLGGKIPKADLDALILRSTENEVNQYYNAILEKKPLPKYKWIEKLESKKSIEFLKYLANAKHAEGYAKAKTQSWDYENNKFRFISQPLFEKQLRALLEKTEDAFLKQRYLFQLVRYQYFNKGDASVIFDPYQNKFPKNVMYYRTMAYLAGSLNHKGRIAQANYYYSLVFENCEPLKIVAHYGFSPVNESDWRATLELCQTPSEKESVWAMLGIIYKDPIRSIDEIYSINPKSKYIDLLALRYIQEVELLRKEKLLYNSKKTEDIKAEGEGISISTREVGVINRLAYEGKVSQPFFINCLAAYLSLIRAEYDVTPNFIDNARKYMKHESVEKSTLRLLSFIHKLSTMNEIGSTEEGFLLSELNWLKNEKHEENFHGSLALNLALPYIAGKYRAQEDFLKAECYQVSSKYNSNIANVEELEGFIESRKSTDYEKFIASLYKYNLSNIKEHLAILYTLKGDLVDAKRIFIELNIDKELKGNPFNNSIMDCNDCEHVRYKGKPYTPVSLLDKMLVLQDNIEKKTDVYNNAILLGNAYYNISHYGSARLFSEGEIIGYNYSGFAIDTSYRESLLGMKLARKNYQLALENAINDEQRAKCYYLLSKCDRNEWYQSKVYKNYMYTESENAIDYIGWANFKELVKYNHTKYAQEVIKECSYYRNYLK